MDGDDGGAGAGPPGSFDELVRRSDPAMLVVTVRAGDEVHGCLVGFHTQVSIDPLRYLVCLSHENATYRAARDAEVLAVHLLARDQAGMASLFGERTADEGVHKFDRCAWAPSPEGPPLLDGVAAWCIGRVVDRVPFGDHTGHILEPLRCGVGPGAEPLRYAAVRELEPGHNAG
jgi:flavin reductase (DIM6/NTAB) family NADH-FMN oxidoreductase RutF